MNNIEQSNFFKIPVDIKLSIFCMASEPCKNQSFFVTIPTSLSELSKIALVCQEWRLLQSHDLVWQLVLNRCITEDTYKIDLSSAKTNVEKVKLYMEKIVNLNDFKSLINRCVEKSQMFNNNENVVYVTSLSGVTDSHFKTFLESKESNTQLFLELISNEYLNDWSENVSWEDDIDEEECLPNKNFPTLEILAQLILFKPEFDVNLIAKELFVSSDPNSEWGKDMDKARLCFELMIKLKYDLSDFFKAQSANSLKGFTMYSMLSYTGITIDDYIACGCDFSLTEGEDFSLLDEMLTKFLYFNFYATGKFIERSADDILKPFFISEEKLKGCLRKSSITQKDVKNFILSLLTKAHLNLNIEPQGISLPHCTALGYARIMAETYEVVAEALLEYDRLTK